MASVTSLDKDLARLRLGKYTVQAANEAKGWIEGVLGESLPGDDLMDGLHDGTVLCKLVPNIKFKQSEMPFVQMENIAMFLRVCQDVLKLSQHDLFLTVDLYEYKDPAQVLQTIGAFSRIAHSRNPSAFPTAIGPKAATPAMSPAATGKSKPPVPSKAAVSSWSKATDELTTAPAWNIHQYGYMGGASQGTQNVVIGARRQITTAAPHVPSLREKEERRKQQEEEVDARRVVEDARAAEEERERQRQQEAMWLRKEEEQRKKKLDEEQSIRTRRDLETREQDMAEQEKIQLREEARLLREAEDTKRKEYEKRLQEERAAQDRMEYQESSRFRPSHQEHVAVSSESDHIKELERQLEEARARERAHLEGKPQTSAPRTITPPNDSEERDSLRSAWQENQTRPPRPVPAKPAAFTHGARAAQRQREMQDEDDAEESIAREQKSASPAPPTPPRNTTPAATTSPLASTRWGFKGARGGSSAAGRPAPSGAMSIVQREMELERQRQKEWERNQQQLADDRKVMTDKELKDGSEMPWDIHQYG
ncbi:Transgelin [Dactylellina cionopaga]|nr:Transgelin [Dactylellina cionopaga]